MAITTWFAKSPISAMDFWEDDATEDVFFGKTGAMGWNLAKSNRVLMATRPGFFQFANWLKWPSEVMVFWKAILYGYTFKCIPEFWNGRFSPDKMSIFGQK